MSCPTGGFPTIRHNELRDICSDLLSEVCSNVSKEPLLQPLTGENFGSRSTTTDSAAHLDIAADEFWGGRFERTFFDVKVFNPFVRSGVHTRIATLYRRCENQKRGKYESRIREVEHASFTPLIWSTSGGTGPACTVFLRRLASMLAEKRREPYSSTIAWLRCRISFALLRSTTTCPRGTCSASGHPDRATTSLSAQVVQAECRFA